MSVSEMESMLMQQATHRLGEIQRLEHALLIERGKLEAADDLAQKLLARVAAADALLARPGEDMMVDGKPMNWWDVHATYIATYRAATGFADGEKQV